MGGKLFFCNEDALIEIVFEKKFKSYIMMIMCDETLNGEAMKIISYKQIL